MSVKRTFIAHCLILFVLVVLWLLVSKLSSNNVPLPSTVFFSIIELIIVIETYESILMTLLRVVSSFVISLVLGLALGYIIGKNSTVYSISKPYITVALSIPSICWVAISIMLFGINNISAIFSVVAIITPVITVNVIAGMKSLNAELMDMAKVFKLDKGTVVKHLVIPQLFPFLISATRFGISLSWKVMIIAEMFGTTNGVGYQINYAFSTFSFEDVLAWTIIFTSLMIVIEYGVLKPTEAKYSLWKTG